MTTKFEFPVSASLYERLAWIVENLPAPIRFSTSFGLEDQILIHEVAKFSQIEIFTIDTGRLFEETYKTFSATLDKYQVQIKSYSPQSESLSEFINAHGPNAFYASQELRKRCCEIRKVEPLHRALHGAKTWISGLRKDQGPTRKHLSWLEDYPHLKITKVYPLLDWSTTQMHDFIRKHHIPIQSLHAKGFPSIGCAPCTRTIALGEDERAGRWWWEHPLQKECGLHKNHP